MCESCFKENITIDRSILISTDSSYDFLGGLRLLSLLWSRRTS